MVAPRIVNKGRIETPQGQAILAAGQKVYLYAQTDLAQRGLMPVPGGYTWRTDNRLTLPSPLRLTTEQAMAFVGQGGRAEGCCGEEGGGEAHGDFR